jgi:hypothetical protein
MTLSPLSRAEMAGFHKPDFKRNSEDQSDYGEA